jgi:putative ABC transport system substrate-binding protein
MPGITGSSAFADDDVPGVEEAFGDQRNLTPVSFFWLCPGSQSASLAAGKPEFPLEADMQRREFISWVGGGLAAWPVIARAQKTQMRHIAWLGLGRAGEPSPYLESLRAGLRELGWIEGRNLSIGVFWATGREDMQAAAREVLASNPEVIVTQELMTIAMQSVQTTKPVVFGFSGDPVDGKLVQSWPRPAGKFTGMSYLAIELVGKRIELLKEWLPETRRIAILARPQHPGAHLEQQATEAVVKKLGIEFSYFPYETQSFLPARDLGDLEKAFRAIIQDRCDAVVVFPDSAMYEVSDRVARFAMDAKLPSVSGWAPFAQKGLLMTYGPDVRELYRSLARYTDRILTGSSPADLPVEVPSKFYLAINLGTAKTLGLTVPPTLLARADEVIE